MQKILYNATREELIRVPLPLQTDTYKPVAHESLLDLIDNSIYHAGFTIATRQYQQASDGNVMSVKYGITDIADSEMRLMIALQNSYNKSVTLKFGIGCQVFVCTNGVISSDFGAFKRKHTGDVQEFAPANIINYIKGASEVFTHVQGYREKMKQIEVNRTMAAELIGRMVIDEQFINPTQMNIIVRELNHPSYNYGAPGSLWELYQFTTYALKSSHPTLWMDNHLKAHNFFISQFPSLPHFTTVEAPAVNQLDIFDVIIEGDEDANYRVVIRDENDDQYEVDVKAKDADEAETRAMNLFYVVHADNTVEYVEATAL